MAMTPRRRSAVAERGELDHAPRSLNELVTCRFSYLTKTSAPVRAESFGAGSMGVRSTCPAMTRRAASISASVTLTRAPLGSSLTQLAAPGAADDNAPEGAFSHFRRRSMRFEQAGSAMYSGQLGTDGQAAAASPSTSSRTPTIRSSNPELFEGVLARRVRRLPDRRGHHCRPVLSGASIFIFVFGIVTLGLGWALFWLLSPASVIWAMLYYGMTLGSPASATSACG